MDIQLKKTVKIILRITKYDPKNGTAQNLSWWLFCLAVMLPKPELNLLWLFEGEGVKPPPLILHDNIIS